MSFIQIKLKVKLRDGRIRRFDLDMPPGHVLAVSSSGLPSTIPAESFLQLTGDVNVRQKADGTVQERETAPTPGWRTYWLENGVRMYGDLEADA